MKLDHVIVAACILTGIGAAGIPSNPPQENKLSDDELARKSASLDKSLFATLEVLAKEYDGKKDAEAAHFFAEVCVGLGTPKSDEMKKLRDQWECAVYLGTEGGAKPFKDGAAIEKKLESSRKGYKEIFEVLVAKARAKLLGDSGKKLLQDAVVKYELARGAAEYIQGTKRFNELRREMKLRPILWDWEHSRGAILAAWYIGETGDSEAGQTWNKEQHAYTEDGESSQTNRVPERGSVADVADMVRGFGLIRLALLKPDARRLWLGHWTHGAKFESMTCYNIPDSEDDRCPVPTPTTKYERETVAEEWNAWKDKEETLTVEGKKVIVVHYPYSLEKDAPYRFGDKIGELGILAPDPQAQTRLGLPISVMFYRKDLVISDAVVTLTGKGSKRISCEIYLPGDKRLRNQGFGWPGILAIPTEHLAAGEEYTIAVTCKVSAVPWEKTWKFTTRR